MPNSAVIGSVARGRYCHDDEASRWLEGLITTTVEMILSEFGKESVRAILLLGSLARGEGSVCRDAGRFILLGDMEFFIVLRNRGAVREARERCRRLASRAPQFLGAHADEVTVDLAPTTVDALRRMGDRTIFAHDLRANPACCWGGDGVLEALTPPDRRRISREDAVRLVSNRIVELQAVSGDSLRQSYWRAKVLLDLAGSLLAFSGCYESSYERRAEALRQLVERCDSLAWLAEPSGLLERLRWATECKLEPSPNLLTDATVSPSIARVQAWARLTWEWEVRDWLGGTPGESTQQLVSRFKARESLYARARGWLKFVLHPLRPSGALDLSRCLRLVFQASPHALCYSAIILYCAGIREGRDDWKRQALHWAPVGRLAHGAGGDPLRRLVDTWEWLLK